MNEPTNKPNKPENEPTKEGNYYCPGCGHQYFDHKTGTEESKPGGICKYCIEEQSE